MTLTKSHYLVIFKDDPQMLEKRQEYGAQHMEYLAQHSSKIKMAGGLRYDADAPFAGGAWIVQVDDINEAEKLVLNDPYFDAKHRKYDIFFWGIAHDSYDRGVNSL